MVLQHFHGDPTAAGKSLRDRLSLIMDYATQPEPPSRMQRSSVSARHDENLGAISRQYEGSERRLSRTCSKGGDASVSRQAPRRSAVATTSGSL